MAGSAYSTWQEAYIDVKNHAKSNTNQLAEIKHSLREIQTVQHQQDRSLTRIQSVVVDDGFVSAVKANAQDLKEFREQEFRPFQRGFNEFLIHRGETCPVARRQKEEKNWKALVIRIIFGGIGVISTLIVILEKISEVL